MNLEMTEAEREAFLAQPRIALICIEQEASAPLAVPIWYGYTPAVGIWIATTEASLKARRLDSAGRFTLVVHDEDRPHRYVSVEGPIVERRPLDAEGDVRPMAERYVPEADQEAYVEETKRIPSLLYVMKPEVWRTMDQSKLSPS